MEYLKGSKIRKSDCKIDKIFLDRWSSRSMSGEEITNEELFSLFEAARWAPSAYNEQPWRFIYVKRNSEKWAESLFLLSEPNQVWCKNAAVLICLVSKRNFSYNNSPNKNHLSDAGAAWENLALQASITGLVSHGMVGLDFEKARAFFQLPEEFEIVQMIAVGKPADSKILPKEIQKIESPNERKSIKEFVFEEKFN